MNDIKKVYAEVVSFLEANKNKKVDTILADVIEMCAKRSAGGSEGSTVHKVDGEVVAVYCYYHKQWELVAKVPYGKKANTSTGLNTMCKEGVSNWTKQQRLAKEAKAKLLEQVASGEVEASELTEKMAEIEESRKAIIGISGELASYCADSIEELSK